MEENAKKVFDLPLRSRNTSQTHDTTLEIAQAKNSFSATQSCKNYLFNPESMLQTASTSSPEAIERWMLETSQEAPWNGIAEVIRMGKHGMMEDEAIAKERHKEKDEWSMEVEFYTSEDIHG